MFEMVPGTDLPGQNPLVDHSRAVKEYSRSSADQEMPLPSELRPPRVLDETMDYLLACIMDKGHVGFWAEWYDFLWNRMRGIRKVCIVIIKYVIILNIIILLNPQDGR